MPGIFSSLSSASYSLQAHSRSVEQAGKNIANINNPHYSRQRVVNGSVGSVETRYGVESGPIQSMGVEQIRNSYIDRQLLGEISYQSSLDAQDVRLRQALANMGETVDRASDATFVDDVSQGTSGIRGSMDTFFDSFESLAANPTDATTRQVVFQSAEALVDSFNRIDSRFDLMERELDVQIESEISSFNQQLVGLEQINKEIGRIELGNEGAALDLRDERQRMLEELSEFGTIEVYEAPGDHGQISISMRDDAGVLTSILEPNVGAKEIYYDSSNSQLRILGSGKNLDMGAGRLPAVLEVRNVNLVNIRNDLDDMANTVATEVNKLYYQAHQPASGSTPAVPEISFFQQPTPPSSAPSMVTAANIALYTAPSTTSVTEFVSLSAADLRTTTSGLAGSNDLALSIADVATQSQSGLDSITLSEFAARAVSSLGQEINDVQSRQEVQATVIDLLQTQRGEVSGVSMDEEVAQLVQYQRAYQASSRYFNVLSDMLETLINSLGR